MWGKGGFGNMLSVREPYSFGCLGMTTVCQGLSCCEESGHGLKRLDGMTTQLHRWFGNGVAGVGRQ